MLATCDVTCLKLDIVRSESRYVCGQRDTLTGNRCWFVRFIIKDKETFFDPAQRSMIAHEILMRTKFDDNCPTKFGLSFLHALILLEQARVLFISISLFFLQYVLILLVAFRAVLDVRLSLPYVYN